jgi:ketosteroid isomerase-like protein
MTPRELMTDYLAAARRGDWETAFGFLADDLLIHIPGRSAFAGERHGKEAVVGYIQTIRERFRDGTIELEVIDMLCSDERVVLLVRERFHGEGAPIEIRRANVYRVEGGKVAEVSIFEADQYVVDELLH